MDYQITCPGCGKPLHVPAAAVGKLARCPHCRAALRLPADPGASPELVRTGPAIPRILFIPAFGLLVLGLAGTLVNAYLAARMSLETGFARDFARGRVREVRSAESMSGAMSKPTGWSDAPGAAVGGAAAVVAAEEEADEKLAAAWARGMTPLHWASAAVSAVVLLGGVAALRGRWLPVAVAGCVAAILNVNHLCCLPGAVVGVWGLLALARDDVRAWIKR
ncbi:MAG TPA: hypothetical protein VFG68_03430 [Fimbriiglobus sp.]|nr:hypothetical protein [Fimbriiglobus sp.]